MNTNQSGENRTIQRGRAEKLRDTMEAIFQTLLAFVSTHCRSAADAGLALLRLLNPASPARILMTHPADNSAQIKDIAHNQEARNLDDGAEEYSSDAMDEDIQDDVSETSTMEWGHEPFAEFQSRVLNLAKQVLWPDAADDDILIERLNGGGYNRVIGVTRLPSQGSTASEVNYVVRIPRFPDADVLADVAAFQFVQRYTNIPAPIVVACDNSKDNAIGTQYMMQTRLDGFDAATHYLGLTHAQKRKFAIELGQIVRNMTVCKSATAGKPRLDSANNDLNHTINIAPIRTNLLSYKPEEDTAYERSVLTAPRYKASTSWETAPTVMHKIFQTLERRQIAEGDKWGGWPWTTFMRMTSDFEARGWLAGGFSLAHLDFEPRNILVNPYSHGAGISVIAGVLDWDSALLAPTFVGCQPPQWIWGWDPDGAEDELKANDEPDDPKNKELKQLFEIAAGPLYMQFAYGQGNRMARRLFRFALDGCDDTTLIAEAKELINEWQALRQLGN